MTDDSGEDDKELAAMATLLKVMQDLDDSAKTRVLSWAAGRFSLSPPAKAGKILPENANSVEESDKPEDVNRPGFAGDSTV